VEILLQYLDDLEDAVYAVALLGEPIRRVATAVLRSALVIATGAVALTSSAGHTVVSLVLLNALVLVFLYRSLARDHMLSAIPST
jgi:hypothetical protein